MTLHDIDVPYSLITDGNSVENICLFHIIYRFMTASSHRPVPAYGFSVVNVLGKFVNFYDFSEVCKLLSG